MLQIYNTGEYHSEVYDPTKKYAIVFEVFDGREQQFLEEAGLWKQVASLHYLYPMELENSKTKPPVGELRKGWKRVRKEIAACTTGVQRVLFVGTSSGLSVLVPGLEASLDDAHGTLFQLDVAPAQTVIVIPTFGVKEWFTLAHTRPYQERDIARLQKLTRPDAPLPYDTEMPASLGPKAVIDLETTIELDPSYYGKITAFGIQWSETDRAIITGEDQIKEAIAQVTRELMTGSLKEVWGQNFQYDMGFMGAGFRSYALGKVKDTNIRARARGDKRAGLKHLANLYTARPGCYAWFKPGTEFRYEDPAYITEDLESTWRLSNFFAPDGDRIVVQIMERAIVMCAEQSAEGSQIDMQKLETLLEDSRAALTPLELQITQKYGVNPGQVDELVKALEGMGYKFTKKTKTGKDSLTAEVLLEHGLDDLYDWRQLQKFDSAFIGKMRLMIRPNGRLPHYQSMMAADTGRSTCKYFNYQQMPRKGPGKSLLISRYKGGKIAQVDLSQAELRVAAYLSGDSKFAAVLMLKDAHRYNASLAFDVPFDEVTDEQRNAAKTVVFRLIYGGQPVTEAHKRVAAYLKREFPVLMAWIEKSGKQAMKDNRVTDTFGKTRNLLDILDYRGRWGVRRAGINSPVQGVASHCAIYLMLRIWEMLHEAGAYSKALIGIHDSTVIDVHPDEEQLVEDIVGQAFRDLYCLIKPMFPLAKTLPLTGDYQLAVGGTHSWADTKKAPVVLMSTHSQQLGVAA